jgi:hypothetical protein
LDRFQIAISISVRRQWRAPTVQNFTVISRAINDLKLTRRTSHLRVGGAGMVSRLGCVDRPGVSMMQQ